MEGNLYLTQGAVFVAEFDDSDKHVNKCLSVHNPGEHVDDDAKSDDNLNDLSGEINEMDISRDSIHRDDFHGGDEHRDTADDGEAVGVLDELVDQRSVVSSHLMVVNKPQLTCFVPRLPQQRSYSRQRSRGQ